MTPPLRVAYFDLGFSREEYTLNPRHYGGGAVAARYLKECLDIEFIVFAPAEALSNVGSDEQRARCITMAPELCDALKRGYPLDSFMGEGKPYALPDLMLHPHTCVTLNRGALNVPVVHFCGFDGKAGHPGNDYILLYDDTFTSQFGEKAKYVRIGKPIPLTYVPHPKAPYVFSCSRHDDHMNSLETARQCRRFGIHGYFAGPIHNNYPLLTEIDGRVTHYLGEIDEATKLGYYRHATLCCLPLQWDAPFNQTVIEAQGQGTPIWATRRGPFLTKYLQPGVNGFDSAVTNLTNAFDKAPGLSGAACWTAASEYSVPVMVESFKTAFREIVDEWTAR